VDARRPDGLEHAPFPHGDPDEREMLLQWLDYLRGAVLRKLAGLDDGQAHWRPHGGLLPVIGIVNHLTHVEWRWIDGVMRGQDLSRTDEEFWPPATLTASAARSAYVERARQTNQFVRSRGLADVPATADAPDLRWVLIHLVNETARHAGHADATRQLLDGTTGE
jgi:uncharacterized damage-inducible protein DinB